MINSSTIKPQKVRCHYPKQHWLDKTPNKLTTKAIEFSTTGSEEAFEYVVKKLEPWLSHQSYCAHLMLNLYDGYQISVDDCRQELLIKLINAIKNYNVSRGCQFLTYLMNNHATYAVVQRTSQFHQFNIPRSILEDGCVLPSSVPIAQVNERNCGCYGPRQEYAAEVKDLHKHVTEIMSELLSAREVIFLTLRSEGLNLQEIGDRFNISRERVRQIESRSYKKIKEVFEKHSWREQ